MHFDPLYQTKLGKAYCADSLDFMRAMPGERVDLVLTSPPYALHFKKSTVTRTRKNTSSGSCRLRSKSSGS